MKAMTGKQWPRRRICYSTFHCKRQASHKLFLINILPSVNTRQNTLHSITPSFILKESKLCLCLPTITLNSFKLTRNVPNQHGDNHQTCIKMPTRCPHAHKRIEIIIRIPHRQTRIMIHMCT